MKKNNIYVSGSIAYDSILSFEGIFSDHFLEGKKESINVSFLCQHMRKEYGGCAANIAYNLSQLNENCTLLGAIGRDGDEYYDRLKNLGIDVSKVEKFDNLFTSQAFITTDSSGNQITSFHPGAMNNAGISEFNPKTPSLGIVAPNSFNAMMKYSKKFNSLEIPFIFDPGQALPMFNKNDILFLIQIASWIAVNEYEAQQLQSITGLSLKSIARLLRSHKKGGVIETLGSKGTKIYTNSDSYHIKSILPDNVVDPTGCGDAFRGGFLFAINNNYSLVECIEFGNVVGGIKVACAGAQNHTLDFDFIKNLIEVNYKK